MLNIYIDNLELSNIEWGHSYLPPPPFFTSLVPSPRTQVTLRVLAVQSRNHTTPAPCPHCDNTSLTVQACTRCPETFLTAPPPPRHGYSGKKCSLLWA
jgi:hypothetical protein